MDKILLVFAGGGAGSVLRYLISHYFSKSNPNGQFPWGTFTANLIACLIFALTVFAFKSKFGPTTTILITSGFCGGLSTFSAFSFESVEMINRNQFGLLGMYIGLSIVACTGLMILVYKL